MDLPSEKPPTNSFEKTEKMLASLLRGCKDVSEQRKRIENWFNESMERVSGWYKRKSHAWIWIIGGILCLLLNADSITLSKRFWNDQTLRDAISTEATEFVKSTPKDEVVGDDKAELDQSLHRMNLLREHLPGVPSAGASSIQRALRKRERILRFRQMVSRRVAGLDLIHPTAGITQVSLAGTDPRLVDLE